MPWRAMVTSPCLCHMQKTRIRDRAYVRWFRAKNPSIARSNFEIIQNNLIVGRFGSWTVVLSLLFSLQLTVCHSAYNNE